MVSLTAVDTELKEVGDKKESILKPWRSACCIFCDLIASIPDSCHDPSSDIIQCRTFKYNYTHIRKLIQWGKHSVMACITWTLK